MYLAGGENILRIDNLVKAIGDQALSEDKKIQVDKMKSICFLINADQKRYSFLLNQLRDGDNVGRDDYLVTITSELGLLIRTEGGFWVNQQSSTYENWWGRGVQQHKERMEHIFTQQKGGTEDNATLVPSKDGKTLNATCYSCRNTGHLEYNFPEAVCTVICSLQVIKKFVQK